MPGPVPPGPREHQHAASQGPRLVCVYLLHRALCFPCARPEGFEGEAAGQAGGEEDAELKVKQRAR